MSDTLYEPDEMVSCMCTKCGWVGVAREPTFLCGGCGKYSTAPLDRDKRRAEAAEAQRNRLEKTLRNVIAEAEASHKAAKLRVAISSGGWGTPPVEPAWLPEARAALSDTTQQETGETRSCPDCGGGGQLQFNTPALHKCGRCKGTGRLPLDPETGGADEPRTYVNRRAIDMD